MASLKMIAASLLLIIASFGAAMAEHHHVNWHTDVDYEAWAANTTLVQGDKLFFNFDPKDDNVDIVQTNEEAYNTCDSSNDPSVGVHIGDEGALLAKTGMYYFINYPNKCPQGWKLQVNVLSKSKGSTSTCHPPPTRACLPCSAASLPLCLATLAFPLGLFVFSIFMN